MTKGKRQSAARVLVLGGYGFIGAAVVRALMAKGFDVCAAGRNDVLAARVLPGVEFVCADLRHLQAVSDWADMLAGFDTVVNCAGVLQDGPGDDLAAVHHTAVAAMAQAAVQRGVGVVQVSAVGGQKQRPPSFCAAKRAGMRL